MRKGLLLLLAVAMSLALTACGGSLTMTDVDATIDRIDEVMGSGLGYEETRSALVGTVVSADFSIEGESAPEGEYAGFQEILTLQMLPMLLDAARNDPDATVKIRGNTLIMKGDEHETRVEFVESGDIFLIKRIVDK